MMETLAHLCQLLKIENWVTNIVIVIREAFI